MMNLPAPCLLRGILLAGLLVLPYPISATEIRMAALEYLTLDMRGMSEEQMQELVDAVRRLPNPRLRMQGVTLLSMHDQPDPAFQELVRKLLSDAHPIIQLEAAIWVAESAIVGDPREPTVFPILVEALESKHVRASWLAFEPYIQDHELRIRIEHALIRLEPYLTQDQRDRLRHHM
jgi:hypothetical protein